MVQVTPATILHADLDAFYASVDNCSTLPCANEPSP